MRSDLEKFNEYCGVFTGVFAAFGSKPAPGNYKYRGKHPKTVPTVLFKNIKSDTYKIALKHNWFQYSKVFSGLHLVVGSKFRFYSKVKKYQKGYADQTVTDFHLGLPTFIREIKEERF